MDYLSERIHCIDTSEIRKVFDLAARIKNPKDLSIGQPDFPVPEPVKEAMIRAIQENQTAYSQTQGILPLREALSEHYAAQSIHISPEHIVISTGVASILFLLFDVLFNPGDSILLTDPYFLIYESLAQYHQLNVIYLPENFTQNDIDNLSAKNSLENLKAVIFATPSNPTGKILDQDQIKLLGNIANEYDALLISDEIYSAYDYEEKFVSAASLYPERTLTMGGFSKSHSMTGLRVGYIAAPANLSEITDKLAALQQHSIVCSPQPAQWGAIQALKTPITGELAMMKKRRDLTLSILERVKEKINFSHPDGAFYVFMQIPFDGSEFVKRAVERELLIVPGYIFSKNRQSVRISYAQKEEVLQEGLDIFCELLNE